jgi:2-methylisocitrate lyase-like PEP mutase family enzyme
MGTQRERADRFRDLHAGEPFVIPNPWDLGSAKALAALGFSALATTSSGLAFTLGRRDGGVTLDEVEAHVRALADATGLPVAVDLEDGYGDPAAAIRRVAEAGAVGGSIEDFSPGGGIHPLAEAVERLRPAVAAARGLGFPFMLTARAENHIRGNPDLDDTIARLVAYERAGADVLYAPGLRDAGQIRAVADAVSRPLNVLAHRGLSMAAIAQAGGQRVSLGGALAWAGVAGFVAAAERIRDAGDFSGLAAPPPADWLD